MTITESLQSDSMVDVEETLMAFGQKCVEFGYYCDQYMREEINLGEITRRLSEATAEAEVFYEEQGSVMSDAQKQRYDVMHKTLESMTTTLIETEIERNEKIIYAAISKGEYFIVNITFNSISSSIYMVYNQPNEAQKIELKNRLDDLNRKQELTQAMMKLLKAIEPRVEPQSDIENEYTKMQKVLGLYNQYFGNMEETPIKLACNQRVVNLFKKHVAFIQGKGYFANQRRAFAHLSECVKILKEMQKDAPYHDELEALKESTRPPDPTKILKRLYEDVLSAQGETNVYSAVVAFNNFAEANPGELKIDEFKRNIRKTLQQKGYM